MRHGPSARAATLGSLLSLLAPASGCYSPDLRDCAVTCTMAPECPDGQMCHIGFCVAADDPVDCRTVAATDAALPRTSIVVEVEGEGRIDITGVGTCSSESPQNGRCMLSVERGAMLTTRAVAISDKEFERWTTVTCLGQSETCTFTASASILNLGAKFK